MRSWGLRLKEAIEERDSQIQTRRAINLRAFQTVFRRARFLNFAGHSITQLCSEFNAAVFVRATLEFAIAAHTQLVVCWRTFSCSFRYANNDKLRHTRALVGDKVQTFANAVHCFTLELRCKLRSDCF